MNLGDGDTAGPLLRGRLTARRMILVRTHGFDLFWPFFTYSGRQLVVLAGITCGSALEAATPITT